MRLDQGIAGLPIRVGVHGAVALRQWRKRALRCPVMLGRSQAQATRRVVSRAAGKEATAMLGEGIQYLWVPVVMFAAAAQTLRNTAQRTLTAQVGTLPATLVRFLYGLPFALLYLLALYALRDAPARLPQFSGVYFGWIALGAVFQITGTAALLVAMKERNFAVAVTLSKTEVLQIALFAAVFLHELPTPLAVLAMVLATVGVLMLSLPPRGQIFTLSAWASKSSLYGLLCGASFALATIGFRGGAVELARLGEPSPWLSGAWGVLIAQSLQTIALGAYVARTNWNGLLAIFRVWRISLFAGSMGAAASLAWFTAYAMQGAAQVRTLGMVEVLFSYIVSRRVFSESLTLPEKLGMACMLLGVVLICLQV